MRCRPSSWVFSSGRAEKFACIKSPLTATGNLVCFCLMRLFSSEGDATSLPAFWNIPIPKQLHLSEYSDSSEKKENDYNQDSDGSIMGEYIIPQFEDIKDSRIDHYDFYGERLSYRDYGSDPLLTKPTMDLSLTMTVPGGGSKESEAGSDSTKKITKKHEHATFSKEFNSFCATACRLALEVDTDM